MIVCTCSRCMTKTCTTKDGHKQNGQFVTRQVQLRHHLDDLQGPSAHTPSREASPEPQPLDDDQASHYAALDSAFEELQLDGRDPSLTVMTLVALFLGWLHLFCGVSRAKCRMARDFILEILGLARHHPILDDTDHRKLPKDIRTTLKNLQINPELEKKICCPVCFTLYDLSNAPWRCKYKKSPMARVCDEELFELKTVYRGIRDQGTSQKYPSILKDLPPSEVGYPRSVYVTQKLSSWLSWFLSKSTTEADILNWSDEVASSTEDKIFDIQQSAAWKDVTWPTPPSSGPEPLNLVFSLFVDWFNPRGNTQRGAQQSMGVLAFNCLNLPPSSRNLIHNTCVAGITPGPNSPDMTTISHVLESLVDDLLLLKRGILIKTRQFPDGRLVRVKLLSLLGDTVGMRKVAGFASRGI